MRSGVRPRRREERPTPILLAVLLAATLALASLHGIPPTPEPVHANPGPPPGPTPSGPPAVIGQALRDEILQDLTTRHSQALPFGLRVWAHPGTQTLRVDPTHLNETLGAWSTRVPFKVSADGFVEITAESALFQPLQLSAHSVFTLGSSDSIQFSDRPMWVNLTTSDDKVVLGLDDGDPTGQSVYIAKRLLHEYGIHRPNATHEDGTPLNVSASEDGEGYWIEVPHFSLIQLDSQDITVLARQDGNIQTHLGSILWDPESEELFISVPATSTTYEVLVEAAWFEAFMPHLALKTHAWSEEILQGVAYYTVALPPSGTPEQLHFMGFRATEDLLYTYGHPEILYAHAFNETLRMERGPMWVETETDAHGLNVTITLPASGEYEILIHQDWVYSLLKEHPLFTAAGEPLPVETILNKGWLLGLVDGLLLRISDSESGPLVPPRYERVPGGVLTHLDGCGIRHLVHIENQTLLHEGPACLNTTTLQAMAENATDTYWLYETLPVTVCAVFYDRVSATEAVFLAAPCAGSVDLVGGLPGLVEDLCADPPWGEKSQEAFCLDGVTRYHAAGLSLDVDAEAAGVLAEVLYFNDHLVSWTNLVMQNLTLYAEEDWRGSSWKFLHHVRWLQPCLEERAFLVMLPVLPESVCGRPINVYGSGNNTVVLDLADLQARWTALYESSPCVGRETIIVLNGVMDPYCGDVLPLVRDAVDGFAGEADWGACASGRGFLFLGLGAGARASKVCGVVLDYPSHGGTAAAWEALRGLEQCAGEVSFVLFSAGGAPDWLCGEVVASPGVFTVVFNYVNSQVPCGSGVPLLVVGGGFGSPVVVCGEEVGDLGGSWKDDWGEVVGSNPCGGEVVVLASNRTEGRLCGYDFAVNVTAWRGVFDAVAAKYCVGAGEDLGLAVTVSAPIVVCGAEFSGSQELEPFWDDLVAAWGRCGNQVVVVPANATVVLGEVSTCGVQVPDLGSLVEDLVAWADGSGPCTGRFQVAVVALVTGPTACGIGVGEDPGLDGLLGDLEAVAPCGFDKYFVLGFGDMPLALCGSLFLDLRTLFSGLEEWMLNLRPCSLGDLAGSEFCGLVLQDSGALCGATSVVVGVCASHGFLEGSWEVLVGYPLPVNGTVLWFIGAPGFSYEADCNGFAVTCLFADGLHGALAVVGGDDSVGAGWELETAAAAGNAAMRIFPSHWRFSVGSLGVEVAEDLDYPPGHEWLTPELAQRIWDGEPIPIGEIENFPDGPVDDPFGLAPLPYLHIRPGSAVSSEVEPGEGIGSFCVLAFVFEHVEDSERLAMGGAGHGCARVLGAIKSVLLVDPVELIPVMKSFGQTIMIAGIGEGNDLSLIEVLPEQREKVRSSISAIDGPCGWRATTGPDEVDVVQFYGHSLFGGAGGQPRTGIVSQDFGSYIIYYRLPLGGSGDSGSPVRFLGGEEGPLPAAAVHTHPYNPPPIVGTSFGIEGVGTSMPRVMELIELDLNEAAWLDEADRGKWRLVDSPICSQLG